MYQGAQGKPPPSPQPNSSPEKLGSRPALSPNLRKFGSIDSSLERTRLRAFAERRAAATAAAAAAAAAAAGMATPRTSTPPLQSPSLQRYTVHILVHLLVYGGRRGTQTKAVAPPIGKAGVGTACAEPMPLSRFMSTPDEEASGAEAKQRQEQQEQQRQLSAERRRRSKSLNAVLSAPDTVGRKGSNDSQPPLDRQRLAEQLKKGMEDVFVLTHR